MTKTPEELTKDWKEGKLKQGWYFTSTAKGEVCPNLWFDDEWNDFMGMVEEVLAPCDYEEMQQLKEFVNLYSHETEITKHLRTMLKECKENYERYLSFAKENGCTKGIMEFEEIITRINAAIGESEE